MAQEKAEQRKQRLVAKEREHATATQRLTEDKARLEAEAREREQELRRAHQALHVMRIEKEKTSVALAERDNEVMRRKREAALLKAKLGGAGAPQLPELVELLGDCKEDWQVAYSIKVEELKRAQEAAAEVRSELERVSREAAQRLKTEQLANAEAMKAVMKERDECKRQAIALEYKLINAEQQLRDMAPAVSLTPTPTQPADAAAPPGPAPRRAPSCSAAGQLASRPPPAPSQQREFFKPQPQRQAQQQHQQAPGQSLQRAGSSGGDGGWAQSLPGSASSAQGGGERGASEAMPPTQPLPQAGESEDEDWDLEALAMHCTAPDGDNDDDGAADDEDVTEEPEKELEEEHELPGDGGGAAAAAAEAVDLAEEESPAEGGSPAKRARCTAAVARGDDERLGKRRRPAGPYASGAAAAAAQDQGADGGRRGGDGSGGNGLPHDADEDMLDADLLLDDDEPVPALPRAYAGLFSNRGDAAAGGPLRGAVGAGVGPNGRGFGGAPAGPSFAAKSGSGAYGGGNGAYGRSGGGSLIGEGPDGRGGTARFPLTSSYAQNVSKATAARGPGRPSGAGRGGGGQARAPVAASGRIDAFLRPVAKPQQQSQDAEGANPLDINHDTLWGNQLVNHFRHSTCLTTKHGLCHTVRDLAWYEAADAAAFYPRAYDISDENSRRDFLRDVRWTAAECLIKRALLDGAVAADAHGPHTAPPPPAAAAAAAAASPSGRKVAAAAAAAAGRGGAVGAAQKPQVQAHAQSTSQQQQQQPSPRQRHGQDASSPVDADEATGSDAAGKEGVAATSASASASTSRAEGSDDAEPGTGPGRPTSDSSPPDQDPEPHRLRQRTDSTPLVDLPSLRLACRGKARRGGSPRGRRGRRRHRRRAGASSAVRRGAVTDDDPDGGGGGGSDADSDAGSRTSSAAASRSGSDTEACKAGDDGDGDACSPVRSAPGDAEGLPSRKRGPVAVADAAELIRTAHRRNRPRRHSAPAAQSSCGFDAPAAETRSATGAARRADANADAGAAEDGNGRPAPAAAGGADGVDGDGDGAAAPGWLPRALPAICYDDAALQSLDAASWRPAAEAILAALSDCAVQTHASGAANIWIAKPAGKSRGRGIRLFNDPDALLGYVRCEEAQGLEARWIAQKYVERPLVIERRKFDIRQWVLVTDWNPLQAWFYSTCYLRFAADDYDPNSLDVFQHLTNNSVSKYFEGPKKTDEITASGNMWSVPRFQRWLAETYGRDDIWEALLQPAMKHIAICTLKAAQDIVTPRKAACQLYGYDFLIDDQLRVWLLEVNASPTLEASTEITAQLCAEVQEPAVHVYSSSSIASAGGNGGGGGSPLPRPRASPPRLRTPRLSGPRAGSAGGGGGGGGGLGTSIVAPSAGPNGLAVSWEGPSAGADGTGTGVAALGRLFATGVPSTTVAMWPGSAAAAVAAAAAAATGAWPPALQPQPPSPGPLSAVATRASLFTRPGQLPLQHAYVGGHGRAR
ncbi:TTL3 protein [Gonium pectorale]|uniref:TTL3 protein n=1 Tax=Gonium pectorale TaxID=33097 RepID=A0A150GAH4_GONPE|nr:TTL3 protein [Gonium pectorale]|eukprot:KXZ46847.1 TTL3 protein [Gonium pectorale]